MTDITLLHCLEGEVLEGEQSILVENERGSRVQEN